jgi:hypothetical protein
MLKPKSSQTVDTHTFTEEAENFKETLSTRKPTATVFWDRKGVLIVEFTQQGTTITSEVYRLRNTKKTE